MREAALRIGCDGGKKAKVGAQGPSHTPSPAWPKCIHITEAREGGGRCSSSFAENVWYCM